MRILPWTYSCTLYLDKERAKTKKADVRVSFAMKDYATHPRRLPSPAVQTHTCCMHRWAPSVGCCSRQMVLTKAAQNGGCGAWAAANVLSAEPALSFKETLQETLLTFSS